MLFLVDDEILADQTFECPKGPNVALSVGSHEDSQ